MCRLIHYQAKVITLSGKSSILHYQAKSITLSGSKCITLSDDYYITRQLLHYQTFLLHYQAGITLTLLHYQL